MIYECKLDMIYGCSLDEMNYGIMYEMQNVNELTSDVVFHFSDSGRYPMEIDRMNQRTNHLCSCEET